MEDIVNKASYKEFVEAMASSDHHQSMKLPTPKTIKELDDPIAQVYALQFSQWNSVKLKCIYGPCGKFFSSPYELLMHKKESHPEFREKFIECSLCPANAPERFYFSQFLKHVYDIHSSHFRFWWDYLMKYSKDYLNLYFQLRQLPEDVLYIQGIVQSLPKLSSWLQRDSNVSLRWIDVWHERCVQKSCTNSWEEFGQSSFHS